MPTNRRYQVTRAGSDLSLRVAGTDLLTCLQAAVLGFASAVADVTAALDRRTAPIAVAGPTPEELLVGLVDELILRLDADGELGTGLVGATVTDGVLRGVLETADLADLPLRGVAPKAATWHGVTLVPDGDGWAGAIMLDL